MEKNFFKISDSIKECDKKALELCKQKFNEIDEIAEYNRYIARMGQALIFYAFITKLLTTKSQLSCR